MSDIQRTLRGVKPRELADLYRAAEKAGCRVEATKNQHIKITTPSGQPVYGSLTARGPSTERKTRSLLRRHGVAL